MIRHFVAVEDKVHFNFNKADGLTPLELLHSHGGIMWQLGRVFEQPEAEVIFFFLQSTLNPVPPLPPAPLSGLDIKLEQIHV